MASKLSGKLSFSTSSSLTNGIITKTKRQQIIDLFGSTVGFFFDSSALSSLYQDDAGNNAVVTDGQTIGKQLDLSPNGFHAIQSTSSRKPLYKTDGIYHWIRYQGTDDVLANATAKLPLPNFTYICAISEEVTGSGGILSIAPATGNDWNSTDGMIITTGGVPSPSIFEMSGPSLQLSQTGSRPTPLAIREIRKTSGSASLYVNNLLSSTVGAPVAFNATSGGGFRRGARTTNGSLSGPYFNGREYASFFIGRQLTQTERDLVVGYMATLSGLTF